MDRAVGVLRLLYVLRIIFYVKTRERVLYLKFRNCKDEASYPAVWRSLFLVIVSECLASYIASADSSSALQQVESSRRTC